MRWAPIPRVRRRSSCWCGIASMYSVLARLGVSQPSLGQVAGQLCLCKRVPDAVWQSWQSLDAPMAQAAFRAPATLV